MVSMECLLEVVKPTAPNKIRLRENEWTRHQSNMRTYKRGGYHGDDIVDRNLLIKRQRPVHQKCRWRKARNWSVKVTRRLLVFAFVGLLLGQFQRFTNMAIVARKFLQRSLDFIKHIQIIMIKTEFQTITTEETKVIVLQRGQNDCAHTSLESVLFCSLLHRRHALATSGIILWPHYGTRYGGIVRFYYSTLTVR